jgi:predicted TIM-barrel fold metal-dependent hydrolase
MPTRREILLGAPDAATRRKILVDNPVRLYGF